MNKYNFRYNIAKILNKDWNYNFNREINKDPFRDDDLTFYILNNLEEMFNLSKNSKEVDTDTKLQIKLIINKNSLINSYFNYEREGDIFAYYSIVDSLLIQLVFNNINYNELKDIITMIELNKFENI